VTTNADNFQSPPSGSLRSALMAANNGDTINFAASLAGQTISLAGLLQITKSVTITSAGVPGIVITGSNSAFVIPFGSPVTVTVNGLAFNNSQAPPPGPASSGNGGALANFGGTLIVSNCTFANDTAFGGGGGSGGAISSQSTLTVVNSTFTGNSAGGGVSPGAGGAIAASGTVTIVNCTIVGNSAGTGGGLALFGTATVENSIVANNTASSGADVSGTISIGNNNLFSTMPTIAAGAGNLFNTNPGLDPRGLQNNGGPTLTIAEQPGSASISAGNPSFVTNPPFSGPPFFDQRGLGFPRLNINGRVDIGAFQFQVSNTFFASGTDAGISTAVTIYNSAGSPIGSFNPFAGTGFTGGVRVAVGDVNGDGIQDLIVGSGRGGIGVVLVYDGKSVLSNPNNPTVFRSFNPYSNVFTGGVFVAAGNLDGGPVDEIVTGADGGGGSQVNIYSAAQIQAGNLTTPANAFFAYPGFTGGVRVACGDVNGDGLADIITAAGPGGGPQINIYLGISTGGFISTLGGAASPTPSFAFFAFGPSLPSYTGGIFVTAEDVNGDGKADLFLGAGANSSEVAVFSGAQLFAPTPNVNPLTAFFAISPSSFTGGVRVGTTVGQFNANQTGPILLASAGPGGGPQIAEFNATSIFNNPSTPPTPFLAFNVPIGNFSNGVFVSVT
jgi:hypothetical protein